MTATPKLVTGDRICTKCSYNLIGQQVVREEHYSLLIVRCPECASVTSVQEYPLLGGWAVRWGVVLAALWCLLLIGMWPASSGIICGMSLAVGDEASRTYARHLEGLHTASRPQTAGPAAPVASTIITTPGGTTIQTSFAGSAGFDTWWGQQDHQAVLAASGGWRGAVNGEAFLFLIPTVCLLFAVGWLWSVFLIQLRRPWLLVWAVAIVGLACVFLLVPILELHLQMASWSRTAARQELALPAVGIGLVFCIAALVMGLWFGRPLSRLIVRGLLPPRLRSSLALLWTAEGLNPPARPGVARMSPGTRPRSA